METANVQKYQEIEYTETHPELKHTENIDTTLDPQTTERNQGIISTPTNGGGDVKLKSGKGAEKGYEGFVQAAGEDGDTERRHFSSLPGS